MESTSRRTIDEAAITLREGRPEDAAANIDFFRRMFSEPGINLITEADEYFPTIAGEARAIRDMNQADNSLYLVAEIGGQIVGILTLNGGKRRNVKHSAVLGITVAREWRGRGIGRRLMAHAVEWARQTDILTRIELHVFARNTIAIALYESLGFEVEGRLRNAVIRDGVYIDDLIMSLLL